MNDVIEQDFQRVWQMFEKTHWELQELKERQIDVFERMEKSDKKVNKFFGMLKELNRNWGKLVEALIKPSVATQFRKWGIPVVGSGQRVEKKLDGDTIEIDLLLTNGDSIIAVEVKTTLSVQDIDDHVKKHLEPFKRFFPEYADRQIYGAVAYIHLEENADRYAYKKGLFVLTFATGDMVIIKNDEKFKPQVW